MLCRIILSVVLATILANFSLAATYYVKPSGNDNNDGRSEPNAWQHISRACTTLVAGDTVLIRAGTYNENCPSDGFCGTGGEPSCGPITPKNSGSPGNYIVYKGYPGERPTIKGDLGGDYDDYAVCFYQKSYIVLDSLIVTESYRGIMIKDSHHITVKNCKVFDTSGPPDGDNTAGIFFCHEEQIYACTVQACTTYDNKLTSGGQWNASGIGAYNMTDCLVEGNVVHTQTGGMGIRLKGYDTTCVVRQNIVYDCNVGIFLGGYWCYGNHAYENIIYDCRDGILIGNEYADNVDNKAWNNTIYNCDESGVKLEGYGDGGDINNLQSWNNIVMNCTGGGWQEWTVETANHSNLYTDYNCFYDGSNNDVVTWHGTDYTLAEYVAATSGLDENSIPQNPMFVNPPYDFHLHEDSPCRGTGLGGVDMGAYPNADPDTLDTIPPAAIDDLHAIPGMNYVPGDNLGEVILSWTTPGDDDTVGIADHYVIKYSTSPIYESNWDSVSTVLNPPSPLAPGDSTFFTLDSLMEGQIYFVAIKTYDEVSNGSYISNVPDTFACGIMVPTQISTETDTTSVTVTSSLVESYMSIYYLFALDSLEMFPNPRIEPGIATDTTVIAIFGELSYDVNYYWRCRAIASDNTDSSSWSPAIEFNLITGIVQTLNESDCVYPVEGEIVNSSKPVFTVRYVPDVENIFFQVDNNSQFNTPIESGSIITVANSSTNWQITEPIEQGVTYYWRISSNNIVWTSPISFSAVLDIHPYPNPFRPSEGHTSITFTNLPQNSSIIISTISGDIVLREDKIGLIDWVWDVKNERGRDLAPGVYLYMIDFPSGSSNGKVMVIR